MGKVIGTVGVVVGAVALAATGIGAIAAPGLAGALTIGGIKASTLLLAGTALQSVGAALTKRPKASPAAIDRLHANLVADAPRKFAFGRTAFNTDMRYQEWWGSEQEYCSQVFVLASHHCESVDEIWLDDKLAWTGAGGVQGEFAGYLRVQYFAQATAASRFNAGWSGRWGANATFAGCATLYLEFKVTGNGKKGKSPFSSSITSRVTVVGKGARLPDPRFDGTAGGAGAVRMADQTTWAWANSGYEGGRNPALALLFYLLGWRIQNPATGQWGLAIGCGVPADRIDLGSFITAANLCDEMVQKADGTYEPRYRCDGVFSEADDRSQVIAAFETAMNAKLRDSAGRFSLQVLHNDLAVPVVDFTDDDVLGDFTWTAGNDLNDRKNVLRGRYTNAGALYQLTDFPQLRLPSVDGIDRIDSIDLPLVQSGSQAQRLAKQRLQRLQYQGTFAAEFNAKAWAVKDGDIVRLTFSALGFDRKLFRVAEGLVDTTGVVPLVLVEENPTIYAWDRSEIAPVQAAEPGTFNPLMLPIIAALDEAGRTAEWPVITGEGKPDDYATRGAPSGTKLGDRLVDDVIGDLDAVNADLSKALDKIGSIDTDLGAALEKFDGIFETVELLTPSVFDVVRMFGTLNSYMRARTTLEGMPIGTVVVETREKTDSAVEDLKLLGARSLDGTAFSLDLTTVMVDAKTSLAQRFTQIEAKGAGDLNALASSLTTAITEGDKASATRLETLEVGAKGISAKVQSLQEAVIDGDDSIVRQLSTLKASNSLMSTTIKDLEEATVSGTNSVAKRVGVIESSLNTADTGVWARIGKAEQVIIANNTATLSKFEELNAAIYSPNGGVKATIADLVEATLTGDTSVAKRVSTIELSLNTADTGVWARIGTAEQAIVSQGRVFGERISTLEVGLNTPGTGVWARIGTAEQAITEQGRSFASRISVIEAGLNTPETGVWARVGSAEQAITTVNSALATFKQDVEASLDKPGTGLKAKVGLLLSATVDPQDGAEAKAVLALKANGRVGGLVATNNGTFTTLDLEFDQTRIFRSDGTLLFRVGSTAAGEDPNAVYMPNVVINRLKAGTVESQHIQKGAASASRFAVLTQDASVARVATYQNIATVSFKKEEAGSYILVRTSLNCRSQDDLQFIVAMSVSLEGGGTYTVSSETNMVFDNTNSLARMPISPFALFSDPAVLAHIGYVAINISIRNTEVDNIPLIIAAGSLVEFVEVKGAMLGA